MKFLPFVLVLFIFGCSGGPVNVLVTDQIDSLDMPPPPPSLEDELNNDSAENSLSFTNNGELLEGVSLFFCQIGIYQEPALIVIESEETDEVNGDGDWAEVKGYYFYIKNQKNLDLNGGLDMINGQYMLTESYKGKKTGYMRFSTQDYDDNFWAVSEESTDRQEFNFQEIKAKDYDVKSFMIKKQLYSDKHQVQDMSLEEEVFEEVEDNLAMVFIDDDKMLFDYSVVRTNFHMGSAQGLATKNTAGDYVWSGEEGCVLTFEVQENSVDVTEKDCELYHGFRATLNGSYSK